MSMVMKVSNIFKKDLLKGNSSYVRNGKLYFNRIEFSEIEFKFFNKNKLLVTFKFPHKVNFDKGETATFVLSEGNMKIELI